jgi:gluconate 2-dehydrogenase gamma chain
MSKLVQISDFSRRDALRAIALAVAAAGVGVPIDRAAAQQVHQHAGSMKGALDGYKRQELTEHEWATVARLAELIVPTDDVSGSAVDAGAVEFIDLLCASNEQLANTYHGGLSWLDAKMRERVGSTFVDSTAKAQTALLDDLVAEETARNSRTEASGEGEYARFRDYQTWEPGDLGPGVEFFGWMRKMAVDAFYTSPVGLGDLEYPGGGAHTEYVVPQEAIDYAMKRSPFA